MNRKLWVVFLGLCAIVSVGLVLLTGCSKKTSEESTAAPSTTAAPAPAATPIDPATAASVSGTVSFAGTAPKPAKIDMSQDPACKGMNMAETVVADGGKCRQCFRLREEMGWETGHLTFRETPVTIDQSGCKYHPHVLGVMAGQTLKIVNSDPTTHNIHPTPADNREWNESQPPQAPALEKNFAREEIMLPVKCNQHPWMKMYVNVVKSPFYAVTGPDGKFEIKGLPPGDYTIGVRAGEVGHAGAEGYGRGQGQQDGGCDASRRSDFCLLALQQCE